jgi:glycosyltransferase involved in cell wall biosynthesis
MKVVFVTPDLSNNSLGRTFCLWQLASALGWSSSVLSPQGAAIWEPLADNPFAQICHRMDVAAMMTSEAVGNADLLIAVKPVEHSFAVALQLSDAHNVPLLLDIDDPDLEAAVSWQRPFLRMGMSLLRREKLKLIRDLADAAKKTPSIVSNPVLQARYGGTIIPHARQDYGFGRTHTSHKPTVAFVGSNNRHKGLDLLRKAVAQLQDEGFTLVVTAPPPVDAKSWERWTGFTSIDQGIALVANADIVVIPSRNMPFARGQLPAKLMDAMILGRAVIVTAVAPMPWALGDTGRVIRAGSTRAITASLRDLTDPSLRDTLGRAARDKACAEFVIEVNVAPFESAARAAIASFGGRDIGL